LSNSNPDAYPEAPETPAHIFAARAFKHAIFGTPAPPNETDFLKDVQPTQPTDNNTKPRTVAVELPSRSRDEVDAVALPSTLAFSPTKPNGILMTPGTTRRNKSVSWKSLETDSLGQPSSTASNRARTKLTVQLQEVRDSVQKGKSTQIQRAKDDTDLTMDYMEPRSQSGKYWKREYESYAENTQREMKKLVMKQKAAKDYAKQKDDEVVDLQTKLRKEQLKVETLEAKSRELAAQMKDYEKRLMSQKSSLAASPKRNKTPKAASSGGADLWANAAFSSLFVADVAAGNNQSPLRARDMNIQSQSAKSTKIRATRSSYEKHPSEDTLDMSLALPQPSPEARSRETPRSSRKSAVDMTIEELVEKYSPEKPHFDRLGLPLGMGSLNFGQSLAGKSQSGRDAGKHNVASKRIASLSDERKAKAQARIEARRLEKLAAAA
jgi:hypothetical protein